MAHKISFLVLALCALNSQAQTTISGYLNSYENRGSNKKVHLTKFHSDAFENLKYAEPVAWSPVASNGSFSFDQKHLSDQNSVYLLYVTQMENAIKDTIAQSQPFILSKRDSIHFPKGEVELKNYVTTSAADREWKRLQTFEAQLFRSQLSEVDEASRLKSYARDSLRILMVKLIGIKQLEDKQLLDQDIEENGEYYLDILDELRESDIDAGDYLFLEKKLAFLTQKIVEKRYAQSKAINFILGALLVVLTTVLVFRRKKKMVIPDLSRQENTIKNLIVEGKSNKEIAGELFISVSTVKTHITNIYGKLKVSSRQELLHRVKN